MFSGGMEIEDWLETSYCYERLKAGNNETLKLNRMSIIWTLNLLYTAGTFTSLKEVEVSKKWQKSWVIWDFI